MNWCTTDIQSIACVGTGSTPLRSNSAYYASRGTPWITSAATARPIVKEARQFVTDAAITDHRLEVYPVGTLLVAMYGEGKTRGQITELGLAATINQACAAIVVDEQRALKDFVKLSLQANYLEMRGLAEGGAQPNLNLSKIKSFPIKIPSLDEQKKIVHRVQVFLSVVEAVSAHVEAIITEGTILNQSIIAKAFRGELVSQNPNDEPATELLKRIAEEKEKMKAAKKATPRKSRTASHDKRR